MALAAIMLAVMEWLRAYQAFPRQPVTYTVVAVAINGFVAYRIVGIRKRLKMLRLGRDGEVAVGQFLEQLRDDGATILHDIVGDGFNLDHVVVSTYGIYTIETKTLSKPARGEVVAKYDGKEIRCNGRVLDRDPIVQAKAQAAYLKELVQESTGKEFHVRPVVLLPGW